ncbi:hypothetical protein ACBI01_003393 [Aeromonas veronii]
MNISDSEIDSILKAVENLKSEYENNGGIQGRRFGRLFEHSFNQAINSLMGSAIDYKRLGEYSIAKEIIDSFSSIRSIFNSNSRVVSTKLKYFFEELDKTIKPVIIAIDNYNIEAIARENTKIENSISGRLKQLEQKQKNTLSAMEKMLEQHQVKISERERLFHKNLNNIIDEANATISSTQIETLNKITEKETELIASTTEMQQKINDARQVAEWKISESVDSSFRTAKKALDDLKSECLTDMQIGIKKQIRIFSEAHKKLNSLLEVAGSDILSKENLQQAEQERKEADYLRKAGFGFLVAAVIYIAIEVGLLIHGDSDVTIERVLIRLIVTLVLMIPSAYLLKESARHRADERNFRKKGIHLATIDSYLANFDDASKLDIKRQLTANFFDNNDSVVDYSTVPDMNTSLVKLLEALVEKAKKEEPATQYPKAAQEEPTRK